MVAENINTGASGNFLFTLSNNNLKEIDFRVQSFSGLGINLGETVRHWQSLQVTRPGDSMTFNDATLQILVDEELVVIEDLYNYMFLIKNFVTNEISTEDWTGTLHIASNRNNFLKRFVFNQCWIKSFDDLSLSTNDTAATPLTTGIVISFDYYTIEDAE